MKLRDKILTPARKAQLQKAIRASIRQQKAEAAQEAPNTPIKDQSLTPQEFQARLNTGYFDEEEEEEEEEENSR